MPLGWRGFFLLFFLRLCLGVLFLLLVVAEVVLSVHEVHVSLDLKTLPARLLLKCSIVLGLSDTFVLLMQLWMVRLAFVLQGILANFLGCLCFEVNFFFLFVILIVGLVFPVQFWHYTLCGLIHFLNNAQVAWLLLWCKFNPVAFIAFLLVQLGLLALLLGCVVGSLSLMGHLGWGFVNE